MTDPTYKEHAERTYDRMTEAWKFCAGAQAEYGRWLINTLWLMHSGAIVGLLFKTTTVARPPYLGSLWWFIVGIVFAFVSAFAAWWNFTFLSNMYHRWSDPAIVVNPERWPKRDPIEDIKINLSFWASLLFGVLSVACLIGGAAFVYCSWKG